MGGGGHVHKDNVEGLEGPMGGGVMFIRIM